MSDADNLTTELADIDERIRALPDDAFGEKHELLKRWDELRAERDERQAEALAETKHEWDAQAGKKRRDDSQDVGMVVSPNEN
jgi:uncharacterized coiled-coil DUF342 family protein